MQKKTFCMNKNFSWIMVPATVSNLIFLWFENFAHFVSDPGALEKLKNLFQANNPFLMREPQAFFHFFRGYKNRISACNGLNNLNRILGITHLVRMQNLPKN